VVKNGQNSVYIVFEWPQRATQGRIFCHTINKLQVSTCVRHSQVVQFHHSILGNVFLYHSFYENSLSLQGLHNRFKLRGANFSNLYKSISDLNEVLRLMGAC